MFICPICPKSFEKLISLSLHYRGGHKKTSKDLYIQYYLKGKSPNCKCGCNEETTFLDITRGFSEYKLGHSQRINNNWGHNEEVLLKSQETRREMWKNGEIISWNKGLTKETDERIKKYGEKGSKTILLNKQEIENRSQRMSENRLNGIIPTLKGTEHSQWKGGISSLLTVCHSNKKLFNEWKYPKLIKSNFSCEECGRSRNEKPRPELEVHHNKVKMATIVRLIAEENSWNDFYALNPDTDEDTFKLKQLISNLVADYHINNNVSGLVLCEECHQKHHNKYNL